MTTNAMSIESFLNCALAMPQETSMLLRGNHGIGKSQIVRKAGRLIARKEKLEKFPVIDRRLSQMSEGDMVGLPSTDGHVTRFNPPDWFMKCCTEPCLLFLDELNRAVPEVMQAAFQICLDREMAGHKLHPQTRVFSAVNASGAYTVNEMDPALLDRFWTIDLFPTVKEWLAWGRDTSDEGGSLASVMCDFIEANEKHLDPPKQVEPGQVTGSRRSWEKLSLAHIAAGIEEKPTDPLFYQLAMGFVGVESAIAYTDYVKTVDTQVSGEDVVNSYDKVKGKIEKMSHDRVLGLIEKVSEYVTKTLTSLSDKQGKNLNKFMTGLGGEHRIAAWGKLTVNGMDKLELAKSIHKHCAPLILDVFGVPMGEAGVGVIPNIPGVFKPPATDKKL